MYKKTLISLAVASSLTLTGCFEDSQTSKNEGAQLTISSPVFDGRTWARFEVAKGQVPIPTDLQFANTQDGTMNAGSDPGNPVITGIDFLDGNSTVAQFDIKFSGGLDKNQELDARSFVEVGGNVIPNPDQNVFLLPLEHPSTDALQSVTGEVPSFAEAIQYQIATATGNAELFASLSAPSARAEIRSLDGGTNNVLRISPLRPLKPKTKYLVVLTNDIKDASGKKIIGSPTYQNLRDAGAPLGAATLQPVRNAVLNWETLAGGYFGFMNTVFSSPALEPLGYSAPSADDIALSLTFTTTAVDDVLKANAAPRTFFESSAKTSARKDAIRLLIAGEYNLTAQPVDGDSDAVQAINDLAYDLLTDPTLQFKLFNQDLADILEGANAGSVPLTYNAVAGEGADRDASIAFALQTAIATAAIDVSGPTIEAQAEGAEGGFVTTLGVIDAPESRLSHFFDVDASPLAPTAATLAQGEITIPYYLGIPEGDNGSVIRTSSWTSNQEDGLQEPPGDTLPNIVAPSDKVTYRFPFAQKVGDVRIPVIATVPNEAFTGAVDIDKPADGWPVIIFQHGIGTDRSASLPLATALATACVDTKDSENPQDWEATGLDCFATVAIDQPLHGFTPAGSTVPVPGLQMVKDLEGNVVTDASDDITERHFNFTANAALQATPMIGNEDFDSSGSLFINLSNFANSRDILRQGVLDMLNLNASLGAMDVDGDAFDTDRVYFVGHSLGAVNGIPFVAINNMVAGGGVNAGLPVIQAAAFLNTGGGVPKLLENSPNPDFGAPVILAGLRAASSELAQGKSGLETYLSVLQGILDSTDPMNFGHFLADTDVLLTQINGDSTVPNSADSELFSVGPLALPGLGIKSLPAPLAGTEPLIQRFGAGKTADGELPAVSRFVAGNHGNPVDPEPEAVFNEMVSQIGQLFSNGSITVTDEDVIED